MKTHTLRRPAVIERAASNTNRKLSSFQRVLETYISAVRRKNVDDFLAIYNSDAYVFDAWDSWSVRGAASLRQMVEAWFSSLGPEYVVVTADEVNSTETEDVIVGHAILTYTAFSAEGEELRSLSNRMTAALRMTDTGWKIFHEHTSTPIDHRSVKAILKRAA